MDWTRPLKLEESPGEDDQFPTEVDPADDGIEALAYAVADTNTTITKDVNNNIVLTDAVTGGKALKDFAYNILSVSTTATAGDESVILCDASGGAFTLSLPDATANSEKTYFIKKTDNSSNKVTVDGNGTQTIDGDLTQELKKGEALTIISDGSNWQVL